MYICILFHIYFYSGALASLRGLSLSLPLSRSLALSLAHSPALSRSFFSCLSFAFSLARINKRYHRPR